MKEENHQHIVSYKEHFGTWIGLLILTSMTVAVSVTNASLTMLTVMTAMTIATTKAILVAYYYMHLKFDKKIYRTMLWVVMGLFVSFMLLTIIDYLTR
jgi:cytochrome c oxidase subunit 4